MKKASRKEKRWTPEEDDILLNNLGDTTIIRIARKLNRTKGAVIRRLERLGYYDIAYETGSFRTYEFAEILGVDSKTIWRWIKEEGLPAKQLFKDGIKDERGKYYYIFPHTFWRWAEKNKHLIAFRKMKRGIILPEPDWLEETIQNDSKAKRHQEYWKPSEDRLIWRLYYVEGMKQADIGEKVGRSRRGVQRRLAYLREQKRKEHSRGKDKDTSL